MYLRGWEVRIYHPKGKENRRVGSSKVKVMLVFPKHCAEWLGCEITLWNLEYRKPAVWKNKTSDKIATRMEIFFLSIIFQENQNMCTLHTVCSQFPATPFACCYRLASLLSLALQWPARLAWHCSPQKHLPQRANPPSTCKMKQTLSGTTA